MADRARSNTQQARFPDACRPVSPVRQIMPRPSHAPLTRR